MIAFDEKGNKIETTNEIGRGSGGIIWGIKGRRRICLKEFFHPPDKEMVGKLKCLVQKSGDLSSVAALPVELTYETKGGKIPNGAIMPFIGGHSIHELYGTASRKEKFAGRKYDFLIQAARNVAFAFHKLHQEGFVVGDISESNIKVLPDATIRFLDTDSFQYTSKEKVYLCTVGTPLWTAPELHGVDLKKTMRTLNHDNFGLAQLIFLLLVGRNPYAGRSRGGAYLGPQEAMRSYAYAYAPESFGSPLLPPPNWIGMDSLPAPINALFCRAFMKGSDKPAARPSASEWLNQLDLLMKEMVKCQDLSEHLHWKGAKQCPWCAALPVVEFFPSSGGVSKKWILVSLVAAIAAISFVRSSTTHKKSYEHVPAWSPIRKKEILLTSDPKTSSQSASLMTTAIGKSEGIFFTPAMPTSENMTVNSDPEGAMKADPVYPDESTTHQNLASPESLNPIHVGKYTINSPGKSYLRTSDRFPSNIVGQYLIGEFVISGEDSSGGASIYALEDAGKGIFKRRFVIKNYSSGLMRGQVLDGTYKPHLKFARGNPLVITGKIAPGVYSVEKTR